MFLPHKVKQEYGGSFVTVFNDDFFVPWICLSIGDYIQYADEHNRGVYLPSEIENEIFRKCVLNKSLVTQMDFLNAGIVSTVVSNIWQYSGPVNTESFNNDLENARQELFSTGFRSIHYLVQLITMAFPYKPEDVYSMDYKTFMIRVAQSERKLLDLKMIETPIVMESDSQEKESDKRPPRPRVDAKKLWDEHQKSRKINKPSPDKNEDLSKGKWWDISPVLETKPTHGINFNLEAQEQSLVLTGHHRIDAHIERAKMIKDAKIIYKDLIESLEKRKRK